MNVRNCKKCGKIFNYVVGPIMCPACKDALEAVFQEVKKYVHDHKGATIPEIAEACDVEVQQIYQWVREERLEFAEDSMIGVECEICGTTIKSGRYCDKCKAELATGFRKSITPVKKVEEPSSSSSSRNRDRMRFL